MKLVYLIITAAAAVFYVLYKGDLSFILFMFLLALPLVLFVLLAVSAHMTEITVFCEEPVTERGKAAAVKITVRNRSVIPISSCALKVIYTVSAPFENGTPAVHTAAVPVGGGDCETMTLSFLPKHCGTVTVSVKSARLQDLMGVTALRKRIGFHAEITVLPAVCPAAAEIESSYVYSADSGTFSKEKPGDDPSEIFMLREYRDGDRHNLIHWKLSGRNYDEDSFIVRELSRPVGSKVLIMTDLCGCKNADEADSIFEAAASVSGQLTENGIGHCLALPYDDFTLHISEITDNDSFYAALAELSKNLRRLDFKNGIAYITELYCNTFISDGGFSRVIEISARDTDELASFCGKARLTVICVRTPADITEKDEKARTAEIVYADAEKLSSGKAELVI